MAIQLNDRDHLIFKLLDEHQVLLEKHIAWFIAAEDKPVLIRDRLRKLFYLDYLLCQRHDHKLPWWTTPTKPLVYMLSPLARTISGASQKENNIYDTDWQRKHLEIANIRMIFLIAQKDRVLQNFQWTTNHKQVFDALISCTSQSINRTIGLISHSQINSSLIDDLKKELIEKKITHIVIISSDETNQQATQTMLKDFKSGYLNNIIFATHQDLYKSGLNKVSWHNLSNEPINFLNSTTNPPIVINMQPTDMHIASL